MERRIDQLGRIVLPIEVRKKLGIKPFDDIYYGIVGEEVHLSKVDKGGWIKRKIDNLGRFGFSKEIRNKLSMPDKCIVDLVLEGDVIKLSRSKINCIMCGSSESVKNVKGVRICQSCIDEIKEGHFWEVVL